MSKMVEKVGGLGSAISNGGFVLKVMSHQTLVRKINVKHGVIPNHHNHVLIFYAMLFPFKWGGKYTIAKI
jgi:hypothetical protein